MYMCAYSYLHTPVECATHSSYKQRLLFIEICSFVLDMFSRNFFKVHFFQPLLELANVSLALTQVHCSCDIHICIWMPHSYLVFQDRIVNVRLHLCRLLPSLKSVLKLPGDRVLLQKLEQTVRKLISQERDPDASQAIRDAVTEMDRIEVAMETVRVFTMDMDIVYTILYQKSIQELLSCICSWLAGHSLRLTSLTSDEKKRRRHYFSGRAKRLIEWLKRW